MADKIKNNKLAMLLLITGAVYFFLKYVSGLVAPVLIAMLFVTIFGPLLKKMQDDFHIHRQVGAVILLLFATLILALLLWILFSWIIGSLPAWISSLDMVEETLTIVVRNGCETVGHTFGIDSMYLEQTILLQIQDGIDYVQLRVVPEMLSYSLTYIKVLAAVGGFLITFLIASILLAKDYDQIMNRLLEREEYHVLLEVICGIIRYIATFVKAQIIIMSLIAGVAALVLGVMKIQHGVLWGILTGMLDVLPFVGTGIVLIPMAMLQFFYGNYGKAVLCILLYVVCIFLREILEPKLIGRRIGVPAIAVLISLYAGIQLFGIMGIIKGPLGFVIIYQTYQSLQRKVERDT